RYGCFQKVLKQINENEGGLEKFSRGYEKFGFHVNQDNSVTVHEWAPGAQALFVKGDFNDWNKTSHPMKKLEFGKWEITIPAKEDGSCPIPHMSRVKFGVAPENKVGMLDPKDMMVDRLCPWATYVVQPAKDQGVAYQHHFYNPPEDQRYKFKHSRPKKPRSLKVYECHVGIAAQDPKIGTYKEFTQNVLPRVKGL
ncbi:unnamed protein product, partial [Meganyctiphanes norvegica]